MVKFSGCRGDASSPNFRRPWRHARALTCASTSIVTPLERPAEPIGELLAHASVRAKPDKPARSRELRRANSSFVALDLTQAAPFDRAPLLRFVPLQRLPDPRCAIRSGQAPDDPASAFAAVRPRECGPIEQRCRPCGFPPGECDAGKLDVRTCRLRFRTARERAAFAASQRMCLQSTRLLSFVREIVGATDRSFAHERPGISSASASNIRRPTSVMHRGLLYPGVPLPIRTFAAWPGVGSFPRFAGQRSWGSPAPFAGLLPHRVSGHL